MNIVDLRAEQTIDLLGTQVTKPRLSWRMEADGRGVMQARYRLRAAESAQALAADAPLLWDSGVVDSDACFDIAYDGPALASMQRVWWDVEITDSFGHTARAAPAWFETGLLSPDDWQGDWIEAEDEQAAADRAAGLQWIWTATALDDRPHAFRLDFDAPEDIERADILLAGKDHMRGVWINGAAKTLDALPPHALPGGLGWDTMLPFWGSLLPFEGVIRPGRNSICALVEADTTGFFPVDGGAFAALIRLHRKDGQIDRIVSGPDWRVMPSAPEGWTDPAFDPQGWECPVKSGSKAQGDPRPAEPAMLLRTDFKPKAPVIAARLYATALGAYDARINGQRVSDAFLAPEITVAKSHLLYQTYDVTGLIADGDNVLGAIVGDGWYASPFGWRVERYGFGPAPRRFRAQLRLDYADGSHEWIATGPGWQIGQSPIVSSEIYDGETYDARLEQPGWDTPGFDASGWDLAKTSAAPHAALIAQTSPQLERMGTQRAIGISQPQPGRFIFDFGQNFSGWVCIRAKGPAGTRITAKFAELLYPDGTADLSNLRLARATDAFILRGDTDGETFEPHFTYHGFRYVEVEGYPGEPTADDIEGVILYSACRKTGAMDFANPLLQQIWDNGEWSQRSNFFAVPTDCPQRDERMGWMGDIQVFLDAAAFNMEVDPFIRRFLLEARAAQRPDGAYPIVVPQPLSFPDVVTAGWSEAGIILPHGLWQRYGDTAVIDENWDAMERWMAYVARDNPDHIWRNNRGLDLGDWLSVDAIKPDDETTPRILCATAYWAFSAQLMAEMARATGRAEAAARYAALRAAIGDAFAAELLDGAGKAGNGSQASQILALYMDLVPAAQRAAAAQYLVDDIRARGMKLSTGFLGTPYLLDVLADAGALEEVSGLLLQTAYPSWGYMPSVGATTVWERWNGDVGDLSMNSYNHYAFGAVIGFFYRRLAGLAAASPGFRRVAVRPVWLPQVGRVTARYDSAVGLIATTVDGDDAGLARLDLTIAANCVADVELPRAFAWREGGQPVEAHPDLRDIRVEGDILRFTVGAGHYAFAR